MNEFVRSDVGWVFDVVTAITVCRQAAISSMPSTLHRSTASMTSTSKCSWKTKKTPERPSNTFNTSPWKEADTFITKVSTNAHPYTQTLHSTHSCRHSHPPSSLLFCCSMASVS